jgi:uncharacterized protein (TIGR02265 family)
MSGPESAGRSLVPSVALSGDVDVAAIRARIPEHHRMRGLFFKRCVDAARPRWDEVEAKLTEPPPRGIYQAFVEYPSRDYFVIYDAAARSTYPSHGGAEAHRRFARQEVQSFASSLLGRVTWSLLGDPAAALMRYPDVFGVFSRGPTATAEKLDPRWVRVELRNAYFPVEYLLGVVEGIVMAFERSPRVGLEELPGLLRFDVRWSI